MTLGGRRVPVRRPQDAQRPTTSASCRSRRYEYFADRDPLTRAVMDRMLAGVSTRKFARVGEPVGARRRGRRPRRRRKTTVSEMFIERTRTALGELMSPPAG